MFCYNTYQFEKRKNNLNRMSPWYSRDYFKDLHSLIEKKKENEEKTVEEIIYQAKIRKLISEIDDRNNIEFSRFTIRIIYDHREDDYRPNRHNFLYNNGEYKFIGIF